MEPNNKPRSTGTATVTIACKLPHGLVMRAFDMVDSQEPLFGGGFRTIKVARERGERVTINGNAYPQNKGPGGPIVGGYAITQGVDKSFWEMWVSQNANAPMVKNKLIFAHANPTDTEAEANEKADIKSGLERLDPKKLPRGLQQSDDMPAETKRKLAA